MRVYTFVAGPYHFEWCGGPYIEVASVEDPDNSFTLINVWDYDTGSPSIDSDDFPERCSRWLVLNSSIYEDYLT